jgi:hypothetical protein
MPCPDSEIAQHRIHVDIPGTYLSPDLFDAKTKTIRDEKTAVFFPFAA